MRTVREPVAFEVDLDRATAVLELEFSAGLHLNMGAGCQETEHVGQASRAQIDGLRRFENSHRHGPPLYLIPHAAINTSCGPKPTIFKFIGNRAPLRTGNGKPWPSC